MLDQFFDVSPYYEQTLAEERLGQALAGRRDKVVLSTKCGRCGVDQFDFSAQRVSRNRYNDYAQITWTCSKSTTWSLAAPTKLSMKQYPQFGVSRKRARPNTWESAESPLHMGMLTAQGTPDWHPAPEKVRSAAKTAEGRVTHLSRRKPLVFAGPPIFLGILACSASVAIPAQAEASAAVRQTPTQLASQICAGALIARPGRRWSIACLTSGLLPRRRVRDYPGRILAKSRAVSTFCLGRNTAALISLFH